MAATPLTDPRHRVAAVVADAHELLDTVVGAPVWSMDPAEAGATLASLTRLVARVAELELRVAVQASASCVEDSTGATTTATWWAAQTRQTRAATAGKLKLAEALQVYEVVHDALAAGDLLADQAAVIVRGLDDLPDDLDPEVVEQAEAFLVEAGADHDAMGLRILGKRVLDVVAPEVGEAHEAKILDREERDAIRAMSLRMWDDGLGTTHGRFRLPTYQGEMLRKALLAVAAPKHRAAVDDTAGERKPSPERMGQAFTEYVERYPADRLPDAGGIAATVVVTIPLETLLGGLQPTQLDTGARISPGLARKLACEAGIIPAVLGTDSQVLDLGRQTRFHTKPQRLALAHRDGGCTAEHCDYPPGLCHAHHNLPWHLGGHTNLKDGRLLCPHHHRLAHDPSFTMTKLPDGKVRFTRRT